MALPILVLFWKANPYYTTTGPPLPAPKKNTVAQTLASLLMLEDRRMS
jgi:hypothetical protein